MDPEQIIQLITGIVTLCAALSAAFPDTRLGRAAKLVNLVGLNVGRAKNDRRGNQ